MDKGKKTVNLQEIARLANVSTATVSRVFGNHPNVRPELRDRVFRAARKHNYHPRLSVKQRNVAVITPYRQIYPVQSYVEMVLSELSQELAERDFRIEIVPQNNFGFLERIPFRGAVGIGLDPKTLTGWDNRFAAPLINIDRDVPNRSVNVYSVCSDEEQGMALAIDRLVQSGRTRIGCLIYGRSGLGNAELRKTAILRAFKRHNLPVKPDWICFALPDDYLEKVGKLLQSGVEALFCPGGNGGVLTGYALSLYGKKVPKDISLIASERAMFSRYSLPPQTTISQDYSVLARTVAECLETKLGGGEISRRTILPYKLIERDSV